MMDTEILHFGYLGVEIIEFKNFGKWQFSNFLGGGKYFNPESGKRGMVHYYTRLLATQGCLPSYWSNISPLIGRCLVTECHQNHLSLEA